MANYFSVRDRCLIPRHLVTCAIFALGLLLCAARASAQLQPGQIQGIVTREEGGAPLPGVTVTVSGPALQADQAEITDANGHYIITQLPSGDDYVVRFYLGELVIERPFVRVAQNKTLTIHVAMPLQKSKKEVRIIRERAPNVDTASTSAGVEINQELLQSSAVRGRTYESMLQLAPGAVDPPRGLGGDVGVSLSGSTGAENNFIIDGLSTSDPNTGVLATQLHQAFIKELYVITGGYQAEYGRATGGIISLVTKSGSNEMHGSVFASVQPFQLAPEMVARLGETLGLRTRPNALAYDYGFELGGPLLKDRLWFYVGFAPTTSTTYHERAVLRRTLLADGQPQRLPCARRDYLSIDNCELGAGDLASATQELSAYTRQLAETSHLYSGIAKLQINLHPDHSLTFSYLASPRQLDGNSALTPFVYADLFDLGYARVDQIHDTTARYVGKLLGRRLQLEALYGYHHQGQYIYPKVKDRSQYTYYADSADPYSLSDFEDIPDCRRQPGGAASFNPCPLTKYSRGGYGQYRETLLQRHQLLLAGTLFLSAEGRKNPLRGSHAIKLGFDFEALSNDNTRRISGPNTDPSSPYPGPAQYATSPDGQRLIYYGQFSTRLPDGTRLRLNEFGAHSAVRNFALYLRDSWNVGHLPGLVVNAGLRWEAQELFGSLGQKGLGIYDNIATRVGAVYDVTRRGRSKLYVNYGRFYQSLPASFADRSFSNQGTHVSAWASDCPREALQPGGRALPVAGAAPGAPCSLGAGGFDIAGTSAEVVPRLKGQYLEEVSLGAQFDVGLDIVLGAGYIYRGLGDIIEDMSFDNGSYFIIGNPGNPVDSAEIAQLEQRIAALRGDSSPAGAAALAQAQRQLAAYKGVSSMYPRAERTYHALVLTAQKRFSRRFSLLASYTYSRTLGNFPGAFDSHVDELFPSVSTQFDLPELLINRYGPLPSDRPHNFKLLGSYTQPLGRLGALTVGLTFTVYSGRPIDVLGGHLYYGPSFVYILPRGSGGRTPTVSQFDLHIGYEYKFDPKVALSVFADVINLFNQRQVTNVDDDYTYDVVDPIVNGTPLDLRQLRTASGQPPVKNTNYGQPTNYQAPLYMRFGARLAF